MESANEVEQQEQGQELEQREKDNGVCEFPREEMEISNVTDSSSSTSNQEISGKTSFGRKIEGRDDQGNAFVSTTALISHKKQTKTENGENTIPAPSAFLLRHREGSSLSPSTSSTLLLVAAPPSSVTSSSLLSTRESARSNTAGNLRRRMSSEYQHSNEATLNSPVTSLTSTTLPQSGASNMGAARQTLQLKELPLLLTILGMEAILSCTPRIIVVLKYKLDQLSQNRRQQQLLLLPDSSTNHGYEENQQGSHIGMNSNRTTASAEKMSQMKGRKKVRGQRKSSMFAASYNRRKHQQQQQQQRKSSLKGTNSVTIKKYKQMNKMYKFRQKLLATTLELFLINNVDGENMDRDATTIDHRHNNKMNYKNKSSLNIVVKGLHNSGQTCFLNCILQALASCHNFVQYLECIVYIMIMKLEKYYNNNANAFDEHEGRRLFATSAEEEEDEGADDDFSVAENEMLSDALLDLLQSLQQQLQRQRSFRNKSIDPRKILHMISKSHKQFRNKNVNTPTSATSEQQDAEELLQSLLSVLIEEVSASHLLDLRPTFRHPHCQQQQHEQQRRTNGSRISDSTVQNTDCSEKSGNPGDKVDISTRTRRNSSSNNSNSGCSLPMIADDDILGLSISNVLGLEPDDEINRKHTNPKNIHRGGKIDNDDDSGCGSNSVGSLSLSSLLRELEKEEERKQEKRDDDNGRKVKREVERGQLEQEIGTIHSCEEHSDLILNGSANSAHLRTIDVGKDADEKQGCAGPAESGEVVKMKKGNGMVTLGKYIDKEHQEEKKTDVTVLSNGHSACNDDHYITANGTHDQEPVGFADGYQQQFRQTGCMQSKELLHLKGKSMTDWDHHMQMGGNDHETSSNGCHHSSALDDTVDSTSSRLNIFSSEALGCHKKGDLIHNDGRPQSGLEGDEEIQHKEQSAILSDVSALSAFAEQADFVLPETVVSGIKSCTPLMRMLTSLTTTSPTPLTGWLGSCLQCCSCHHVRPIHNAPFVDIPIVPRSVTTYLSTRRGRVRELANPSSYLPSCTLEECLTNFTCVERVSDVECTNCAIKDQLTTMQEEIDLLKGAIDCMERREFDATEMRNELSTYDGKYTMMNSMDSDDAAEAFEIKPIRTSAFKCLLLTRLPPILCLHVQRRYYDNRKDRMVKAMQHVAFPEVRDVSNFCAYSGTRMRSTPSSRPDEACWAGHGHRCGREEGVVTTGSQVHVIASRTNPRGGINYKLMSVVEHRGNAHGGHYQTYRRITSPGSIVGQWALASDENVRIVEWTEVRRCQAYMLFYEAM